MLEPGEARSLEAALGELAELIWLRLEERGTLARDRGAAELRRLLERPLGIEDDPLPPLKRLVDEGPLARLVEAYELSSVETLAVLAALAPELDEKFDLLYGGLVDRAGAEGLTCEALRNLLGRSFASRVALPVLLAPGAKLRLLQILEPDPGPAATARVRLNPELTAWLCGRTPSEPEFSSEFPARRLETVHGLDELVLPGDVRERLVAVRERIASRGRVLGEWGFAAHHDNALGYHVLFHGPPGTGKTMAAAVLGAEVGMPVYRIDLSLVVSKYIGETEKNLAGVFERAESREWILFFDEADALFGTRGEINDARDRYANQEVSYLLQRLEVFSGVSILATNLARNIDEAFLRRIHSQVQFPVPQVRERTTLWKAVLPPELPVADEFDPDLLAEEFELTGGEIRNAVFHAAGRAAANGGVVTPEMLREGVRVEYEKSGRMFPRAAAAT